MMDRCFGKCDFSGPPPDYILSMPPPPLPSFVLPKPASVSAVLPPNYSQPCLVSFMCETNPNPRESDEILELIDNNKIDTDNTWIFLLVSSCTGVLVLGICLALILLKCKETFFSSCNISYHDSNIKQGGAMMTLGGEPTKANPFTAGGILYPCGSANNRDLLQNQLVNDSRLLWATLTPQGTRHFIADTNNALDNGNGIIGGVGLGGHYEVIDGKKQSQVFRGYNKRTTNPIKSFDNNGFVDYDYEDPTPLMDSYHDDLDSGYQEPQEVIGTLQRSSLRQLISSPTRIDNPNIPPLNFYSTQTTNNSTMNSNYTSTLSRKATLNRRISDASVYTGANM